MERLLEAENTLLLVIDIQEKFEPVLFNAKAVVSSAQKLIEACGLLNVPVVVSEQYPKGLGPTVAELKKALPAGTPVFEKTCFGCYDDNAIRAHLEQLGRNQVLVCGLEAHVCVNQTVTRLLEAAYQVYLIEEAIGARSEANYHIGLKKMAQLGALSSCVEMALFELMRTANHSQFKAVQAFIK